MVEIIAFPINICNKHKEWQYLPYKMAPCTEKSFTLICTQKIYKKNKRRFPQKLCMKNFTKNLKFVNFVNFFIK